MAIEKTSNNNNPPSGGTGGEGSKSALELESLARVDMKKMSQSELYALSLSSSSDFDLSSTENLVIPNIKSNHQLPDSIATTTATSATRIFAFSHRRGRRHHRRISASENDVAAENRLILNSLEKLVAEREANDSNPRNDVVVADNDGEVPKRKRKRKSKALKENVEEELQGLGVISVNGEEIDLKFLASVADGAFEGELKRKTEGMIREDEFLGFLTGLEGRWGSSRKRRKYVDAVNFVKALPGNWKILLSLRPRARKPSLYCRRFVSPTDEHFKSCKDVAFYLKSQFVTNDANTPDEGAVMPVENDHQAGPDSVAIVPLSSVAAEEVNLLETSELRNVPIISVVECNICRDSFTSIGGLESHLQKFHGTNVRRLDLDELTGKRSISDDVLRIRESNPLPLICQTDVPCPIVENSFYHKSVVVKEEWDPLPDTVTNHNEPRLGEGSLSMRESSNETKKNSEVTRNLKTRCMWCLNDFTRAPVDAETLASSTGFICPKCKEEISGRLETTLCKFYQRTDK